VGIAGNYLLMMFYTVVTAWMFIYMFKTASGDFVGNTPEQVSAQFDAVTGNPLLLVLTTLGVVVLGMLVCSFGVKKGLERVNKILMLALLALIVVLVVYVMTIDGTDKGYAFYLIPDFTKITWSSVLAAMGQAFYSLSLGMGAMIVYGSYTGKEINLLKSASMICIFDTFVALLAGMAIFPAVFHFASVEGIAPESLKLEGLMLMFETLPKVFESIGVVGHFIEFFFFAMVTIAAVTSVISIMEVSTQFIIQKFKIKRKIATLAIAILTFALSIPVGISLGDMLNGVDSLQIFCMDYLSFLDTVTNTILMPICALFSCVAVGWFIGPKKSSIELNADGLNTKVATVFSYAIKYLVPLLIAVIEVFGLIGLIWPNGSFDVNG
jgi:NSS family neurotransmitter:Na+ symporter